MHFVHLARIMHKKKMCENEQNKELRSKTIATISEWLFNIWVALLCRLGRALPPFLVPILNPFLLTTAGHSS
jgi:hypothetical protein